MSDGPEADPPLVVRIARRLPYARRIGRRFRAWRDAHERSARNITRKNTLRAYDRVYGSDSLLAEYLVPARLAFYDEVAERCASLRPRRIIDIGCGTGHLLSSLVGRLDHEPEIVVGVDHSSAGLARARALAPRARWMLGDLYGLPPLEDTFDLVLCTEVLEHLERPERAVDALCGLCAPEGLVAITVPDGEHDSWEGHVNFWTESDLSTFLGVYGLVRIERIQGGDTLLAWLSPQPRAQA